MVFRLSLAKKKRQVADMVIATEIQNVKGKGLCSVGRLPAQGCLGSPAG